jgi:dipeptidyl aminopeptidase/acylaminoacyl peptidase
MKSKIFLLIICLQILLAISLSLSAQELTVPQIMAEPSIAGMRPEAERLSPDGSMVVFMWNAEGKEPKNVYLWNGSGEAKVILRPSDLLPAIRPAIPENKLGYGITVRDEFTRDRENQIGNLDWSPDSKKLLFTQNGDLWTLNLEGDNKPKRLTRTQTAEVFARWLDDHRIAFLQGGNIFVIDTEQFSLVQLTREANPTAFISVQNSTASRDGQMMAYVLSDSSKQRALVVPNYLDEFVQAQTTRRGWSEQRIFAVKTDGSTERAYEAKLPKSEGAGYIRSLRWASDNRSLVIDRIDKDLKRRQLFYIHNIGGKDEQVILVTEETDPKWVAGLSRIVEPDPLDAATLIFGSERDGYNHLYLAQLEYRKPEPNPTGEVRGENPADPGFTGNVNIRQLTKGNFEVDWAKWNGLRIFYSSTEAGTEVREFYAVSPLPDTERVQIYTGDKGMKTGPQIEEIDTDPEMLFTNSQWNKPAELFRIKLCPNCAGISGVQQITHSTPAAFGKIGWVAPKFIDIPAKDGKAIKSKIYLPLRGAADVKRPPMVVFVHGAGYLQNTINGWNNYYREFMFNELLVQKGYVVLDIDYRGSAGYGQAWRTDVYDFLGGLDMRDEVDAIDYAVAHYGVDAKKVGVYGGSYGGFMAEMLIFRAPDKVAAAAALRPVADWKNYYASSNIYTAERLGFPEKNPEAYKRSSPISYADKLERPLLILHGLQDDNVHVQDSMQLVEKLIRLGKTPYFEAMFYPAENHGFTRPESWTDEYGRILTFFEKHLK